MGSVRTAPAVAAEDFNRVLRRLRPAYALLQVPRIAAERGLDDAEVRGLVESRIQSRDVGFLGEPRVNVLELNLALDALTH